MAVWLIQIENMIELIRESFINSLPGLEWMDPLTRNNTLKKAVHMIMKIGYPDFVEDAQELDQYYERVSVLPENKSFYFLKLL